MPLVRSISNHPYGNRMRIRGDEYEAAAEHIDLLISLRRVVPVLPKLDDEQAYATRELQAAVQSPRKPPRRVTAREPSASIAAPPPDES